MHSPAARNGPQPAMWRRARRRYLHPPACPHPRSSTDLMKAIAYTIMSLLTALPALAEASPAPPHAEIANSVMRVKLYLPDTTSGFYRGTRFDWSGVVGDLQFSSRSLQYH